MYLLLFISTLTALFITISTAPILGINQVVMTSFSPMTIYIIIKLFNGHNNLNAKYNKIAITIILFSLLIIILKLSNGQNYFKAALTFLLIPMFISITFEELSDKDKLTLKQVILIFFLTECGLAIFERIFSTNLFMQTDIDEYSIFSGNELWTFRSTSLLGHPLANAMAVVTIMSFILTNKKISLIYKLILFTIGYISLFCFNARGAIITTSIFMFPYIIYIIHKEQNKKIKLLSYLFIGISCYVFLYLVSNTSLGGRLINQEELLDGSAQTRLDVFSFYNYLTTDQLLWGNPDLYLYVMRKLEAGGVENGIIVLILNYGIIITFIMLPLLIYFHYTKLSVYNNAERIWIMAIFYILGTMNPNLATPVQWTIWLFSYYAFRNKTFQYKKTIVHQKTIRNDEKDIMAVQRKIR